MEKIIHITVPEKINSLQERAIEVCRDLHPAWEVKIWQDPVDGSDFPLGKYYAKANSGAQLADLIRLDVVYRYGGIYIDSDVILRKSLEPLTCYENFFCSEDGHNLTNAVFGAKKGSHVIGLLISELLDNEPDWSLPPTETTGPRFFARVLQWRRDIVILPRDTFYPYNYNEPPREPEPTCFGVHLWEGSWLPDKAQPSRMGIKHNRRENLAKRAVKGLIDKLLVYAIERHGGSFSRLFQKGHAYPYGADLVAYTSRGFYISLPGKDLSIVPEIALKGTYEEPELLFLEKNLRGGDFFVDVGCNVGIFSLVAAKRVGPFGRVYAFDPNPEVLTHLKRSLVMNWVHDRVVVENKAVGNRTGRASLQFSKARLGDATLGLDSGSAFHSTVEVLGESKCLDVDVVPLDRYFRVPIEIKILKIDVEGHEQEVVEGAENLIKERAVKFILLELVHEISSKRFRSTLDHISRILSYGYVAKKLTNTGELRDCEDIRKPVGGRNLVLQRVPT